jgi:hypothetical protein
MVEKKQQSISTTATNNKPSCSIGKRARRRRNNKSVKDDRRTSIAQFSILISHFSVRVFLFLAQGCARLFNGSGFSLFTPFFLPSLCGFLILLFC